MYLLDSSISLVPSVLLCFKPRLNTTSYSNMRWFILKDFFVLQWSERIQKTRRTQNQVTGDN